MTGRKLYVYGDSISHGWDDPSYPGLVACELGLELVNASVGGTSIEDPNQYPAIMAAAWEPGSVIMFAPGVNDAILYGADAAHETLYRSHVSDILEKIKAGGFIAIFGTPVSSCDEGRFGPNSFKAAYAALNRDLLDQANAPTVHLADYSASFTPSIGNTHDCLHPSMDGNRVLSDIALSAL